MFIQETTKMADQCCSVNPNAESSRQGNKKHHSLVPIPARDDASDSEDDKPLSLDVRKKSAVKRLPFGNSPVKRNALVVTQAKGNIHKTRYDPVSNQKQRWSSADRSERLLCITPGCVVWLSAKCGGTARQCIDGSLARDEDGGGNRLRRRRTSPF